MMYAGETVEITNSAVDFDGVTPVTPTTIGVSGSAVIEIVDSAVPPAVVVATTPMIWDEARVLWTYLWSTPDVAGTYQAKVTVAGDIDTTTFAYLKVRLTAPVF